MAVIPALIYLLLVPAGIAAALAAAMASFVSDWSLRRRSAIAAAAAGLLPMSIPIAAVMLTDTAERALPIIVMLVVGLIIAAVVGLPVALALGRRSDRKRGLQAPERAFD